MFEDMREVFRTVIKLAEERRKCDKFEGGTIQELLEYEQSEDNKLYKEKDKALTEYLDKLDFEQIKILQTIMYLGRDQDYDSNDTPEQIYKKQREYFDNLGWNEKWMEVEKILEKAPLDQYLKKGLEILKIEY